MVRIVKRISTVRIWKFHVHPLKEKKTSDSILNVILPVLLIKQIIWYEPLNLKDHFPNINNIFIKSRIDKRQ